MFVSHILIALELAKHVQHPHAHLRMYVYELLILHSTVVVHVVLKNNIAIYNKNKYNNYFLYNNN